MKRLLVLAFLQCAITARSAPVPAEPPVAYGVPERPWKIDLGHHRALVAVAKPAAVVHAHLPWRVQFGGMENHRIIVIHAASGDEVGNVVRATADRIAGDILFEAPDAGEYFIYYLPLRPYQNLNDPSDYVPYTCTAAPEWRTSHGLDDAGLANRTWPGRFPAAKLVRFEARSEMDRFDPMAVIATPDETAGLLGNAPPPMLLFPEDRTHPIRMKRDLPLRWIESGPSDTFTGTAQQDEYFAFQIGVFAPTQALTRISAIPTGLAGPDGATLPAAAVTCFNLGGIDSKGVPFSKTVNVPAGGVQALWFGVDVAADQKPGIYQGTVTVGADGVAPQAVAVRLEVENRRIASRGDNEPWRHSRLRWLNSTAGTGESVPSSHTPLQVEGGRISCLGRTIALGRSGLPAQIAAGRETALAEPARFVVEGPTGPIDWQAGALNWVKQSPARVSWASHSTAPGVTLGCEGELEYDGHAHYKVSLTASGDLDLRDIRLELPLRPEAAPYLLGAGHAGGARPADFRWAWQGPFNSFWLGSTRVGVQCKLLGGSYTGPMLNLYHPAPPAAWFNGGKGGLTIAEGAGVVLAKAFSGPRRIKAGESLVFEFSLLATPVRPLDPAGHLRARYFHCGDNWRADGTGNDPLPPEDLLQTGVNVVNLHHASTLNPYINYPFLRSAELRELTTRMHARGVKIKIYDTVRELTNMVTEIWALRSLGDEVYATGGGGGYAWCREHLLDAYQPAWFQRFGDSPPDAAMVTSGDSRWYNYYVEGIRWLVENTGIDGLYLDDVSYDRRILQRVRTVMDAVKPGCLIDLHSNTAFSIGAANHYAEFMPYLDRIWFGESFNYAALTPDQWLVQVSGIPFGVMGEMLHEGGQPWRGAVFGLTNRLGWVTNGHRCDPRPVWRIWDRFGITDSRMTGWWEAACPVKCTHPQVKATAFVKDRSVMIALASWSPEPVETELVVDWRSLGLNPSRTILFAPRSPGFQKAAKWRPGETIRIPAGRGWLILADDNGPVAGVDDADDMTGRPVLGGASFEMGLPAGWRAIVSKEAGSSVSPADGGVEISAAANVGTVIESALPAGVGAVECRLSSGSDRGETWGPGLSLVWSDGRTLRINARIPEGRFGVDVSGMPQRFGGRLEGSLIAFRIRLDGRRVIAEAMNESADGDWQEIAGLPLDGFTGRPVKMRIGKECGADGVKDHSAPGSPGKLLIRSARWYR
jgi:hypothetical protein